ncbi:hypothetical protein [Devosia sp. CAU 1758]
MTNRTKRIIVQVLAGLAVASVSALVLLPVANASFDPIKAVAGAVLALTFAGLAVLVHR